MKQYKGFTIMEVLIALTVLLLTAGGVVVWQKKVSPKPSVLPTPITLPSVAQPQVKKESKFWAACNRDSDCAIVPHPCCPGWTSIVANKDVVKNVSPDDPVCNPKPLDCISAAPPLSKNTPVGCQSNRCVVLPPQPTFTPPASYPPISSKQVSVTVSKSLYTRGEEIEATIRNNSKGPIVTNDHKFACSALVLEHRTPQGWKGGGWCPLEIRTLDIVIEAGEEKVLILPTSSAGGFLAYDLTSGTYRLRFDYVPGRSAIFTPDQVKEGKTLYSEQFQIL